MSAGTGYRYLLKSVAAGDGQRSVEHPLVRYYHESGAPPGTWLGSGLPGIASGRIGEGDEVTEDHLRLLLGEARDPVTGAQLGRAFDRYQATEPNAGRRDGRVTTRSAVAGYDLTFSAPKSVSTLWGCADAGVQALIMDAHHRATRDVLDMIERHVACTRVGATGVHGAVAQADVRGLIAVAYDHYDSRAGDPQLHTHVVIANRVQGIDGKWRTIDGRPLHAAVVAMSEHYNAVLADTVHATIGTPWEARERGRDRNPAWEIGQVPEGLITEFSARSVDIETEKDRLIAQYVATHGRHPSAATIIKLRQQATLSTRPDKHIRPLAEASDEWRQRAEQVLGQDPVLWAGQIAAGEPGAGLRADDIDRATILQAAGAVVASVGDRRSTWRRWNLIAEASRLTMPLRFATATDREAVIQQIADEAEQASIRLTPTEQAAVPDQFRLSTGESAFRPSTATYYSSRQIMAAEDRLLALAQRDGAPTCPPRDPGETQADVRVDGLGADQREVVELIATSGRRLDLLVGPAGAGKTRTLAALRAVWEQAHGEGSVVGLAPSAAAAHVLADDLGIACENTAKWLWDHARGHQNLQSGQLVLVDEASLAGTLSLDKLAHLADQAGAKIVLIGDWAQLAAVDAGGAFGMLARQLDAVPELCEARRFVHQWEKDASIQLRVGDEAALDSYEAHGRFHGADTEQVADAAYQAWRADQAQGLASILIAPSSDAMTELNTRARRDLIATGRVDLGGIRLQDGTHASRGDIVVTRRNDRRLHAGGGWVKNGDRWQVVEAHNDGALTLTRADGRRRGTVTLPATYVAEHVDLGYAITAHRAQGATVDSSHLICPPAGMTREVLYVAMTRGRQSNSVWVALDHPDLEEHQIGASAPPTARAVLTRVLATPGAELSAHERRDEQVEQYASIAQLAGEYETIAQAAQADRWVAEIETCGLDTEAAEQVLASDAFGALTSELRRTEAQGLPAATLLRAAATDLGSQTKPAADPAAALAHLLRQVTSRLPAAPPTGPGYIAGLIPTALGPLSPGMAQALSDRARLIEQRAASQLTTAIDNREPWTGQLGQPPTGPGQRREWLACARTIAAYRDRHHVTGPDILGQRADTITQRIDRQRAEAALTRARALAAEHLQHGFESPSHRPPVLGI